MRPPSERPFDLAMPQNRVRLGSWGGVRLARSGVGRASQDKPIILLGPAELPLVERDEVVRPQRRHIEIRCACAIAGADLHRGVDGSAVIERREGRHGRIGVLWPGQEEMKEATGNICREAPLAVDEGRRRHRDEAAFQHSLRPRRWGNCNGEKAKHGSKAHSTGVLYHTVILRSHGSSCVIALSSQSACFFEACNDQTAAAHETAHLINAHSDIGRGILGFQPALALVHCSASDPIEPPSRVPWSVRELPIRLFSFLNDKWPRKWNR
jgi:hypothetical protein